VSLLAVSGLVAGYRLGTVLHGVDLEVPEGGGVTLLGRNGVGKSTLVHAITGLWRPRSGASTGENSPAAAPTCWPAPASRWCRRTGASSRR
jgi:ABC-type branched-subunit amino acid transport system ATPase component